MDKEKFNIRTLLITALFIAAIVVSGYIGYWLGGNQPDKAASGWTTYTNSNPNFSFSYPANWKGELKEGYLLFTGPADDKGRIPNMLIQVIKPDKNYSTSDDLIFALLNQIKTNKNQTLISYTQTEISSKNAGEIVYSYSYNGLNLKQHQLLFQDDNIYRIIYTYPAETYSENLKVFEKVKQTFKFTG